MPENIEGKMHKGVVNVSDRVIYAIGYIIMVLGFLMTILGMGPKGYSTTGTGINYALVAAGMAVIWIGVIVGFISGYLGNRFVPEGYGEE